MLLEILLKSSHQVEEAGLGIDSETSGGLWLPVNLSVTHDAKISVYIFICYENIKIKQSAHLNCGPQKGAWDDDAQGAGRID